MSTLYSTSTPDPDGADNGMLGPIFSTGVMPDAEMLCLEITRSIPKVLPECGGPLEYAELEYALFGNQLRQPLDLTDILSLISYSEAIENAITTLRRAGVIECTGAHPKMYLRLTRHHE